MIYLGSRYQDEQVTPTVDSAGGTASLFVMRRRPHLSTMVGKTYVWAQSDRIDRVAAKFYGSGTLWWLIMDANLGITDPAGIAVGTVVNIP